jgi:putative tricarboxylic transport membrane protein
VEQSSRRTFFETKIKNLLPTLRDWKDSIWPILRGTVIGFFLGILPGGGATIASFVSYAVEKKASKFPEMFGTGMIQGVAGPESANNAATGGAFIPLLTLGIPANPVMAIMLGALLIHGMQPGPLLLKEQPGLFWGVVASMYIGNIMLLILNLPMIKLWVSILKIPYPILFPLILLFCIVGSYSLNNSITDVMILIVFGVIGYGLRKFEYETAPLILALVLGPMLEVAIRQSLLLSAGSPLIFVTRPISSVLMLISFILLVYPLLPWLRRKRGIVSSVTNLD